MLVCAIAQTLSSPNYNIIQISNRTMKTQESPQSVAEIHRQMANAAIRVGKPDDAIAHYRKALLFNPDQKHKGAILYNLARLFKKHRENRTGARLYYMEFIKHQEELVKTKKSKRFKNGFFRDFYKAYSFCYPRVAEDMKQIINDENAFKLLVKDAYQKWNLLSPVHQTHIRLLRPDEYQQFKMMSESMKCSMLYIMSNTFTDQTIIIIHDFIYKF